LKKREKHVEYVQPFKSYHPRLSLCMIVKNEAENLAPCIHSVKEVVDEIIVVDTGSTDHTKEVARQIGARVYDFAWCDDFCAARNESIKCATGDYILWLDADDRMARSEVEKLRRLKRMFPPEKNQAYYLVVNNQSPVDGETLFQQMRIFPNVPGAAFEGRVHEQIFQSLGRLGIKFVQTDVVIRHTGYDGDSAVLKKSERNLKIIEEELEAKPDDLILHYNAARTLAGIGRQAEGVLHMRRIVDDEQVKKKEKAFFFESALLLGKYYTDLHQYEEARSLYQELSRDFEGNGLAHFCLGQLLFQLRDYEGAAGALEKSLQHPIEVSLFPVNLDQLRYYQYYTLGKCYEAAGRHGQAGEMFRKSLSLSPTHFTGFQNLAFLALKNQQYEGAVRYYEQAIVKGGGSDSNYANLGLVYRKLRHWSEAEKALTRAIELNPKRIEALTNLGHLYCQKKEYEKALHPFHQALELEPGLLDVRLALSEIHFRLLNLEKLVEQCDALLKDLGLPRDITLSCFEEVSLLYERIGESLKEDGRNDLSLMAYQVSFLIHPIQRVMDKIIVLTTSSGTRSSALEWVREALKFHGLHLENLEPVASSPPAVDR